MISHDGCVILNIDSQVGSVVSVPAFHLCALDSRTGALHADWGFQSQPDCMGFPYGGFPPTSKTGNSSLSSFVGALFPLGSFADYM